MGSRRYLSHGLSLRWNGGKEGGRGKGVGDGLGF